MREPLESVTDDVVVQLLRDEWGLALSAIEHLPWGFGAWHWAAFDLSGRGRWFVTADEIDHRDRAHELETTYAAALALYDGGLRSVVPCLRSSGGPITVLVKGCALSVTEWVEGSRAEGRLTGPAAAETSRLVSDLHQCSVPSQALVWDHRLRWRDDLERLGELVQPEWSSGPLADTARSALRAALGAVPKWLERHEHRAAQALAGRDAWVATHGEPGLHNQLVTAAGRRLVDWESMRVAPRERDLTDLARSGTRWRWGQAAPDPAMLELFDLHWRLDEIGAYAARFRLPHTGGANDHVALGGLVEQLERPDWATSL